MDVHEEIINKVSQSELISFDLEEIYPQGERVVLDIKDQLYEGLILREKDFRAYIKQTDWSFYKAKNVSILCSEDVVIPTWAFMLLAIKLEPYANMVVHGNEELLEKMLWLKELEKLDLSVYNNRKVVIKGCSHVPVPVFAYMELSRMLRPIASSIMFGEPCSTVPLYKQIK